MGCPSMFVRCVTLATACVTRDGGWPSSRAASDSSRRRCGEQLALARPRPAPRYRGIRLIEAFNLCSPRSLDGLDPEFLEFDDDFTGVTRPDEVVNAI